MACVLSPCADSQWFVRIACAVALMEDQMLSLPRELHGVCLSGKQSALDTARALKDIKEGHAKV